MFFTSLYTNFVSFACVSLYIMLSTLLYVMPESLSIPVIVVTTALSVCDDDSDFDLLKDTFTLPEI